MFRFLFSKKEQPPAGEGSPPSAKANNSNGSNNSSGSDSPEQFDKRRRAISEIQVRSPSTARLADSGSSIGSINNTNNSGSDSDISLGGSSGSINLGNKNSGSSHDLAALKAKEDDSELAQQPMCSAFSQSTPDIAGTAAIAGTEVHSPSIFRRANSFSGRTKVLLRRLEDKPWAMSELEDEVCFFFYFFPSFSLRIKSIFILAYRSSNHSINRKRKKHLPQ